MRPARLLCNVQGTEGEHGDPGRDIGSCLAPGPAQHVGLYRPLAVTRPQSQRSPRSFEGLVSRAWGTQSCSLTRTPSCGKSDSNEHSEEKGERGTHINSSCLECGRDLTQTPCLCSVVPSGPAPPGLCTEWGRPPLQSLKSSKARWQLFKSKQTDKKETKWKEPYRENTEKVNLQEAELRPKTSPKGGLIRSLAYLLGRGRALEETAGDWHT